jgi:hypothetical protein
MIKIFKGDDTNFMGRTLKLSVDAGNIDLTGCRLELSFLGIKRVMDFDGTRDFILSLSADETSTLPLGIHMATIRLYDDQGRRYTLSNTVKICVTDVVSEAYDVTATISNISVSIPNILAGSTFDLGGSNGDTRAFLAQLAAALGAKVINSEEGAL